MTDIMRSPEQWDICIAFVRFADNPRKGKARPVLVLQKASDRALYAFKITSKDIDGKRPCIPLKNWNVLGLLKPSWLQLEPIWIISSDDFGPVIGKADDELKMAVSRYLESRRTVE
jgi:hypothetical protein